MSTDLDKLRERGLLPAEVEDWLMLLGDKQPWHSFKRCENAANLAVKSLAALALRLSERVTCGSPCRYAENERIATEEDTDLHGIGDKLYRCRNGVLWCEGETHNPTDFSCSLGVRRQG